MDLINRRTAIYAIMNTFAKCLARDKAIEAINGVPAVEAEPVRHGHWEIVDGWDCDEYYRCTQCGAEFIRNDYLYCPNCGARMNEVEQDGND